MIQVRDSEKIQIECSIEKALNVIGGKWSFLVLRERFGE